MLGGVPQAEKGGTSVMYENTHCEAVSFPTVSVNLLLHLFYLWGGEAHAAKFVWRSKDNFRELVPSFPFMCGPRIELGSSGRVVVSSPSEPPHQPSGWFNNNGSICLPQASNVSALC